MMKPRRLLCLLLFPCLIFTACAKSPDNIIVISREDGSGTKGAFTELFNIGNDTCELSEITEKTSVMMLSVSGNKSAVGYISLGSLDSGIKALRIDGIYPSAENIKDGSYKMSRSFNIAFKSGLNETAADFINYILSSDGQRVAEDAGYVGIMADEARTPYNGSRPSGRVTVAGSSSIAPVMEKLKEGYLTVNPNADIEIQQNDSTTGIRSVSSGICDIGMASRELTESEQRDGIMTMAIALDGIVVIVNNANPISSLTKEDVKKIYTGEITLWSELMR